MKQKTQTERPMYRVAFSRITGTDRNGRDELARPKEIGVIRPRKNGKAGGILQLDIIPVEMAQRQGVIFLVPVDERDQGGGGVSRSSSTLYWEGRVDPALLCAEVVRRHRPCRDPLG